jgi:DNA-binding NarL/FixJ family response regulator
MMESDTLGQGPATLNASGPAVQPAATPPGDPLAILRKLGLTPRQTDVLIMLLKGFSNKLIARGLNLSVETVKDHVAAVLRTLGVSTRTQAVLAVSQMMHTQGVLPGWMNTAKP